MEGSSADQLKMEKRNQFKAGLSCCVSWILMGYTLGYPSPAIPSMLATAPFELTDDYQSWLGAIVPFAAAVGAVIGVWPQNRYGRQGFILVMCSSGFALGYLVVALSSNIVGVLIGRFISGLASGWCTASVPLYIAETVHKSIRGAVGAFPQILVSLGFLVVYVVGTFVEWKTLSSLGIIFCVVLALTMTFMPESPVWLLKQNLENDASTALRWLRGPNYAVEDEIKEINNEIMLNKMEPAQLKDLVTGWTWKPVCISCIIMFFQQFSGVNAILFFASTIFTAGGSNLDANVSTIIIGVVQVVFTATTAFYVDRLGRRPMLIGSSLVMSVSLLIMGGYYFYAEANPNKNSLTWLPLFCLMLFMVSFSVGFGPVPWIVMGEMMPSKISTLAAMVATCFNWLMSGIVTLTFHPLKKAINQSGTFIFYGVICMVAAVFVTLVFKETKCKSIEEIEAMFRGEPPLVSEENATSNEGFDAEEQVNSGPL